MTKIYPKFVIEIIILGLVLGLAITCTIYGRVLTGRARNRAGSVTVRGRARAAGNAEDGRALFGWGWKGTAIALLVGAYLMFPYDMAYHQYTYVEGIVSADVGVRILGTGTDTTRNVSQVYAVPIEHKGIYRCDDTRCSLLRKGNTVGLWCIRQWQWASTSGWSCRFERSSVG